MTVDDVEIKLILFCGGRVRKWMLEVRWNKDPNESNAI